MVAASVLHAKLAIGIVGNIATISTSLAPIPTFWRICKQRSTEEFSFLPYAMSFACNLLWGWYALPIMTSNNFLLLTICTAQVSLQSIYLLLYFSFTGRYGKVRLLIAMLIIGLIFTLDAVTSLKILGGTSKSKVLAGTIATTASILTFASPLSIMGLVIKTRSVEYMPLLVSLALLLNCCTWTVYAMLGKDLFLTIAEVLGVALATAQLTLYTIYFRAKPRYDMEQPPSKEIQLDITPEAPEKNQAFQ